MQLVKLIILKRIKTLYCFFPLFLVLFPAAFLPVLAQDNSPYSRYGLGDLVPSTHIINRSMGGISAGYADHLSINFNNPASYASFETVKELKSKKLVSGRAILDLGINIENRTLSDPAVVEKFTASNALFSYLQVGMPLRKNWGLSFGLRPISRISYKQFRTERLTDPLTGLPIDSALTRFEGDGGSYLASIGTGFSIFENDRHGSPSTAEKLSIGFNAGYFFGEKDYSTRRSLLNDTVEYYQANYETKTNFGNLYFNAGIQYRYPLNKKTVLTVGAYGNWGQKVNASQDIIRETYTFDINLGEVRLDSVSDQRNIKGKIQMPATYTVGFQLQKYPLTGKEGGWLLGIDFNKQNWNQYRFYGQRDSVQNKWEVRAGAQFNPVPKKNYFSNVAYRFGFFTGPDYIKVGQKLNQVGASLGLGLPIGFNRQVPYQRTSINLSFEYIRRGNDDNILRESLFRFSAAFSLSDFWFIKRKYD
jgi:hypothetical protein